MAENIDPEITMDVDSVEDSPSLALAVDEADSDPVIELEVEVPDYVSRYTAEAWAVGERGGDPVGSSDPAYHNNAKYYAENAANAEAWAVGTRGGTAVGSSDPAYHNNSKYYAQLAQDVYERIAWEKVQADCNTLTAEQLLAKYPVGTELNSRYETVGGVVYDCPWIVLGVRDCEWQDGTTHLGLWLGMKYATYESVQYDATEGYQLTRGTDESKAQAGCYYFGRSAGQIIALNLSTGANIPYSTYTFIQKTTVNNSSVILYGYNRYKDSAIRQWLNSGAGVGEWWTAAHVGDNAPSQLSTLRGFKAGFSAGFLSVLHPVKVQAAANTSTDSGATDVMYDTFFLPSVEEMYGVPEVADVEGPYFPYWEQATGLDEPSNSGNNGRKIGKINSTSSMASAALRSVKQDSVYNVYIDGTGGGLGTSTKAKDNVYATPVCVISAEQAIVGE